MDNMDEIHCRGYDCEKTTRSEDSHVKMRYDVYMIPTGYYCDNCYENNYPYRKDNYYDYLNAGEYLEDDY